MISPGKRCHSYFVKKESVMQEAERLPRLHISTDLSPFVSLPHLSFSHLYQAQEDEFIHCEEGHLEEGHDKQLDWADLA